MFERTFSSLREEKAAFAAHNEVVGSRGLPVARRKPVRARHPRSEGARMAARTPLNTCGTRHTIVDHACVEAGAAAPASAACVGNKPLTGLVPTVSTIAMAVDHTPVSLEVLAYLGLACGAAITTAGT